MLVTALLAVTLAACEPTVPASSQVPAPVVLAYEPGLTEMRVRSQPGETLEEVARREGIDPERLRPWNPLAPQGPLPAGTELKAWKVLAGALTPPAS
jgi:hypothetical protein